MYVYVYIYRTYELYMCMFICTYPTYKNYIIYHIYKQYMHI